MSKARGDVVLRKPECKEKNICFVECESKESAVTKSTNVQLSQFPRVDDWESMVNVKYCCRGGGQNSRGVRFCGVLRDEAITRTSRRRND